MRCAPRWLAGLLPALAIAGCQNTATQVIVHVDADDTIRERAQTLTVRVIGESGDDVASQNVVLRGPGAEATFPFEQPIHPRDGDASRGFHLAFELFEAGDTGTAAAPFARERVVGTYQDGARLHVYLRFTAACAGFLDCGSTETCVEGACAPACVQGSPEPGPPPSGRTTPTECDRSDAWDIDEWSDTWPCEPSQCVARGVVFRSIGAVDEPIHRGFAARVEPSGARITVPAADLPTDVGTGDRIVLAPDTPREETAYILGRVSSSRLVLQSTLSRDLVDVPYRVERAFTTLQAWEDEREGALADEGRTEVGVCYADAPFLGRLEIDGSLTSPERYLQLTVAPGARHRGRAGRGVRLAHRFEVPTGTGTGETVDIGVVDISTPYTRVDWVEIDGWSANNQLSEQFDGYHAVFVRDTGVELSHLLIHNDGAARNLEARADGVHADDLVEGVLTVRNSAFYDIARSAIVLRDARSSRLVVEHVTAFNCMRAAYTPSHGCIGVFNGADNEVLIRSSVAHAHQRLGCPIEAEGGFQRGAFFLASWTRDDAGAIPTIDPASGGNLSTDRSAFGEGAIHLATPIPLPSEPPCYMGGTYDHAVGDPAQLFMRVADGLEDFHLVPDAPAVGAAANRSGELSPLDVDGEPRPREAPWDIGADQVDP